VIRPCDANETAEAWRMAIESRRRPVALVLTRQEIPTLDRAHCASAEGLRRGAYIIADAPGGKMDLILIASGSEVNLALAAQKKLVERGAAARVVSMPSWDLFDAQPQEYRDEVLPPTVRARLAIEAGVAHGWHRYVGDQGDILAVNHFGVSAPAKLVFEKFGFTADNVVSRALKLLPK
jgi:transketolase